MYATDLETGRLTLGVSGKLWEGSLVMVDRETESLWSHLLGEAMQGPLTGTRLKRLPASIMEWWEWKLSYPDSTVVLMPRSSSYFARGATDPDNGLLIGLDTDEGTASWSLADLRDSAPLNDLVGSTPVLVTMEPDTFTVSIFNRCLANQTLEFESRDGQLIDRDTGSTWNPLRGEATDGPKKGSQLIRLPGILSDAAVWSLYYGEQESAPTE